MSNIVDEMMLDVNSVSAFEAQLLDLVANGLQPSAEDIFEADEIQLNAPEAFDFLETESVRFKVVWGGRAGAKSWQIARALIKAAVKGHERILCAREFQSNIGDSVHKLLKDQINDMGLAHMFDIRQTTIRCRSTASEFIFKGLRRNIKGIKSLEGVTICWVEEAQAVSAESWRILLPTIRIEDSEIWVSFNPEEESDPTYQMFIVHPEHLDDAAIIRKVSYKDNPWLSRTALSEAERLRRSDPEAYAHEWGGECWSKSEAQVLAGKWRVDDFDVNDAWNGPYFGLDFGFASDPMALVELYVTANTLYVRRESGGVRIGNTDIKTEIFEPIPLSLTHTVRADNARPETIHYLSRDEGLKVKSVEKWNGSVEDGIAHLRSYDEIVVHPTCREFARECRLYRYKTDPLTGDVIRKLVDKHNHYIDATRYALGPLIKPEAPLPEVSFVSLEI